MVSRYDTNDDFFRFSSSSVNFKQKCPETLEVMAAHLEAITPEAAKMMPCQPALKQIELLQEDIKSFAESPKINPPQKKRSFVKKLVSKTKKKRDPVPVTVKNEDLNYQIRMQEASSKLLNQIERLQMIFTSQFEKEGAFDESINRERGIVLSQLDNFMNNPADFPMHKHLFALGFTLQKFNVYKEEISGLFYAINKFAYPKRSASELEKKTEILMQAVNKWLESEFIFQWLLIECCSEEEQKEIWTNYGDADQTVGEVLGFLIENQKAIQNILAGNISSQEEDAEKIPSQEEDAEKIPSQEEDAEKIPSQEDAGKIADFMMQILEVYILDDDLKELIEKSDIGLKTIKDVSIPLQGSINTLASKKIGALAAKTAINLIPFKKLNQKLLRTIEKSIQKQCRHIQEAREAYLDDQHVATHDESGLPLSVELINKSKSYFFKKILLKMSLVDKLQIFKDYNDLTLRLIKNSMKIFFGDAKILQEFVNPGFGIVNSFCDLTSELKNPKNILKDESFNRFKDVVRESIFHMANGLPPIVNALEKDKSGLGPMVVRTLKGAVEALPNTGLTAETAGTWKTNERFLYELGWYQIQQGTQEMSKLDEE